MEPGVLMHKPCRTRALIVAATYFPPLWSIIGTTVLNGSVRNGKRCFHRVKPPRSARTYGFFISRKQRGGRSVMWQIS